MNCRPHTRVSQRRGDWVVGSPSTTYCTKFMDCARETVFRVMDEKVLELLLYTQQVPGSGSGISSQKTHKFEGNLVNHNCFCMYFLEAAGPGKGGVNNTKKMPAPT